MKTLNHWILIALFWSLLPWSARCEIELQNGPDTQEWKLSRGSLNFTLLHPLRAFHGHLNKFEGKAKLNPGNLKKGLHIEVFANSADAFFDEPEGRKLRHLGSGGKPPDFRVAGKVDVLLPVRTDADGTEHLEMAVNYQTLSKGSFTTYEIYMVPVKCSAGIQTLLCKISWETSLKALKFDLIPRKIFFIPINDSVRLSAEFVFGSPSAS